MFCNSDSVRWALSTLPTTSGPRRSSPSPRPEKRPSSSPSIGPSAPRWLLLGNDWLKDVLKECCAIGDFCASPDIIMADKLNRSFRVTSFLMLPESSAAHYWSFLFYGWSGIIYFFILDQKRKSTLTRRCASCYFCLRPSDKDQGITCVVVLVVCGHRPKTKELLELLLLLLFLFFLLLLLFTFWFNSSFK